MPTEPTTTLTTLTRWAVLKHGEQARNLVKFPRCETREKALRHAEEKDRAFPHGAPHRVARVEMTITEEATA